MSARVSSQPDALRSRVYCCYANNRNSGRPGCVFIVRLAISLPQAFLLRGIEGVCERGCRCATFRSRACESFTFPQCAVQREVFSSYTVPVIYRNIEKRRVLSTVGKRRLPCKNKQTSSTQTPASAVTISKQLRNRKPAMLQQLNRKYSHRGSRIETERRDLKSDFVCMHHPSAPVPRQRRALFFGKDQENARGC
ncbi:Uncharacterized protein DBV15_06343 [Temnothorax longispinosus]|uniref:Uncharacterized protein n=1 Tax=Temnothorax longispinosus TaxID=300112 RepID=A0A4S2L323_9HYME|nr:Uncharacterized protein DBV15_06343 [Temnothorax longispinosus]